MFYKLSSLILSLLIIPSAFAGGCIPVETGQPEKVISIDHENRLQDFCSSKIIDRMTFSNQGEWVLYRMDVPADGKWGDGIKDMFVAGFEGMKEVPPGYHSNTNILFYLEDGSRYEFWLELKK